jgi:hypothetical protein
LLASADDRDGYADRHRCLGPRGRVRYAGGVNVVYGTANGLSAAADRRFAQDVLGGDAEAATASVDRWRPATSTATAIDLPSASRETRRRRVTGMVVILHGGATGLWAWVPRRSLGR